MTSSANDGGNGSNRLPAIITAGGKTRTVSLHMRSSARISTTAEHVRHVLENWMIRGIKTDADGRQSLCYWAYALPLEKMVRVAVPRDDTTIITAFRDTQAARKWRNLDIDYFNRKYQRLEVRDASSLR